MFVTHDRNEAYRLCDELVVLSHGRVEAAGPKRELFEDPGTLEAARVTGCKNIAGDPGSGRSAESGWTPGTARWKCEAGG